MINNCIRNICLISFALIAPISLPAGGIQKSLNQILNIDSSREIIISAQTYLLCYPDHDAEKLREINPGDSLLIIRNWTNHGNQKWTRVELLNNTIIDNSNKPNRGWVRLEA
tara:strand:- start:375 stop:710 length:336 start_codon:yes stop_codon:yes gene_type:complete